MDFESSIISSMNRFCNRKDKLLLCVSGGIDSIVLFDIMQKNGWNFSVAHCNFSLRGNESDEDEQFVRNLCSKHSIMCHVTRFDTNRYAKEHGVNTQIAARELRYDYFAKLKKEFGYDYIVVAHHLDDSIETFFINLLRGTGLKGLSGISDSRNDIIRPMLGITRRQIASYAEENRLKHREDSSNSQDHYLRNRLRHHIIPKLAELSENFRDTMLENFDRLSETENFVQYYIDRIKKDICSDSGNCINISEIKNSEQFNFILFRILHPYGFNPSVISQLETAILNNEKSKWFYGEDKRILLENDKLTIHEYDILQNREIMITEDSELIEFFDISEIGEYKKLPGNIAYIDRNKISFPLILRKWKAGDRIHPLGMKGSKTIGNFLTDRKVSLADREKISVVVDSSDRIIWITGMQIDDNCKITHKTRKVVRLDAEKLYFHVLH